MVVWVDVSVDAPPSAAVVPPAVGTGEVPAHVTEVLGRPGSDGEHRLQELYGTAKRATAFYANQVRDHLLPTMVEFVREMEMVFVASSSASGSCHSSVRTGAPGFLHVLGPRRLALPERGRGRVVTDVVGNGHVGLLMVDFTAARIGLHVNGAAHVVDDAEVRAEHPSLPGHPTPGGDAVWVLVEVEEAFIHCRKHIPTMTTLRRGE